MLKLRHDFYEWPLNNANPHNEGFLNNLWMFYVCINSANEIHSVVVLCILYHISMEDQAKSTFTYTDCIPTVSCLTAFAHAPNLFVWICITNSYYLFRFMGHHENLKKKIQLVAKEVNNTFLLESFVMVFLKTIGLVMTSAQNLH